MDDVIDPGETMKRVVLYSKSGCHLCDVAMETIEFIRQKTAFEFSVVDIQSDPQLYERYRYQIPVVCIDGEAVFRHSVDAVVFAGIVSGDHAGDFEFSMK
ncbi:glutaredoxin family protein [Prosthecochloris sp. ZM]|nr:glutaredoxin family protein [Prosthecochloris sp. ZM]